MRVCGVRTAPKNAKGLSTLALLSFLLFCAAEVFGQGSLATGNPVVTNGIGQPLAGAIVAICNTNPGSSPTVGGCPGHLATLYTSIALGTACSGTNQPLNNQSAPSIGSGCSNPGLTDSGGNVIAFAQPAQLWCEYYGQGIIGIQVVPCIFPGTSSSASAGYWYLVTAFGAACDGVTDDTASINAAITAANATGGGLVLFPTGKTCYSATGITATGTGLHFDCTGGWSSKTGPSAGTPSCTLLVGAGHTGIDTTPGTSSSVEIKNLWIKGQDSGTNSANGLHITSNAPHLERLYITGFGNCGVSTDTSGVPTTNNANFWKYDQVFTELNKGDGFCFIPGANENDNVGTCNICSAISNGGKGFNIPHGVFTNTFISSHTDNNAGGAYYVDGGSNVFINPYAETTGGLNTFTLDTNSDHNYIVMAGPFGAPIFGGAHVNQGGNTIYYTCPNCTGGSSSNTQGYPGKISILPPVGSTGHVFQFQSGQFNTNDGSIADISANQTYLDFNNGFLSTLAPLPIIFYGPGSATIGANVNSGQGNYLGSCWGGTVVSVNDGAMTSGTQVLTSGSANFSTTAYAGEPILIAGAGPAGATLSTQIAVITNNTTVTVGSTASATVSGVNIAFGGAEPEKWTSQVLEGSGANPTTTLTFLRLPGNCIGAPAVGIPAEVMPETTQPPSAIANNVVRYSDPSSHTQKISYNNGPFYSATQTIGSGTSTSNGTAIAAGVSQAQPAITITGATVTDVATCSLNAAPVATWQTGIQLLPAVVTANTVTPWLSNPSAGSITPAAAVIRCTVTR